MFKLGKILCFIITFMVINGCKKDPKIEGNNNEAIGFNCGRSKFLDTILVNISSSTKICSSISGSNNIYLATLGASTLEVVKMDCDANFIWKKSYTYGNEKVIYVSSFDKFDDFYVLTATDSFTINGMDTVKAWISDWEDPSPTTINCDRSFLTYVFNPKFNRGERTALTNYSRLYKYDGAGNLQWQKNLNGNYYDNYYNSSGICADTNGNIYALTAAKKTYSPVEVFTFTNTTYPAYDSPLDSNSFTVTKIDPYGNQVSSVTMNKIYSMNVSLFRPAISVSAKDINVTCDRYIYVFDMNLNYINKTTPVSANCIYKRITPISNPKLQNSYFNVSTSDGFNYNYFLEAYNGANLQSTSAYSDQGYMNFSPCIDDKKNIYFSGPNYYVKYNENGSKMYSVTLPFFSSFNCLTSKLDQVYLFYYANPGSLVIVKPDQNGIY